ncbi:glycosyltransferase family 2 protein [Marinoscillum furvescens]|uniref:Glycosyltransferase involved in cell wall biosynthesis n=1 Tax=Marinoscillum furvescens DSM 4134 TaxID=1122208 RepID=A0A3D9KVS9_MARFU|nr:glycosyltransferase family 2 protein [Marinoscillum furvescens]RED91760.1 glycosyltransferase involved in cell wall biosynthesis [Marinoscillum furvescens DSM 4134]
MSEQAVDLSIVVPVYNEEESLPELFAWICRVVDEHQLVAEVLFIDDGSQDSSWQVIKGLYAKDGRAVGIKFNRNYGKSAALQTGFERARGAVVVTMDADLQDSPDELPELVRMIREEGFQLVSGWKKKRHDPLGKTIPSKFFNRVTRWVSGIKLHDFNCGLKAYDREVVKNIEVYGEMHRYIPLIAKWNGFYKIGEKVVQHRERKYGTTKFGLERFIHGFLDLISVSFVTRFRKKPMHFFGTLGILSFLFGMMVTVYVIGDKLYRQYMDLPVRDVVDQPLFFLALVGILIGSQMFLAGFLGEMIIQANPKKGDYLISETLGDA